MEYNNTPEQQARRNAWDAEAPLRQRIQIGYDNFPERAFTAYLTLPDTDLHDEDLLEHFADRYLGTYHDIDAVAAMYLRCIGWTHAIPDYLICEHDTWTWDYDRLYSEVSRRFHFVADPAGTLVFEKQPERGNRD
jgi:hypothetical protein